MSLNLSRTWKDLEPLITTSYIQYNQRFKQELQIAVRTVTWNKQSVQDPEESRTPKQNFEILKAVV